jgi:hypothetical protein
MDVSLGSVDDDYPNAHQLLCFFLWHTWYTMGMGGGSIDFDGR